MKLTNLIWVLALAGSVAACNTGSPTQGCDTGQGINTAGQCETCAANQIVDGQNICSSCPAFEGKVDARNCTPCEEGECVNSAGECEEGEVVGSQGQCAGGGTGGTGGTGGQEGACTDLEDTEVYANLTYIDDAGATFTGSDASAAMGSDCIFGTSASTPLLPGCGDEARAVVACFPTCDQPIIDALALCDALCVQDGTAEASPPGLSDECVACTGGTVACGAAFCTGQCVQDTNAPGCIQCRCDNFCTPDFDVCTGLPSSGDCD